MEDSTPKGRDASEADHSVAPASNPEWTYYVPETWVGLEEYLRAQEDTLKAPRSAERPEPFDPMKWLDDRSAERKRRANMG
jgi:hypothetical protein